MKHRHKAICILGMHRSGTSAVSRTLNLLGVDLGGDQRLIQPATANPKGFWEHKGITDVQQRLLETLSRSWDTAFPLPDDWWKDEKIKPLKEEMIQLVQKDFSGSRLWGWKDPRSCLTLPLWKEILTELNVDFSCLIVVRHPVDVAASLQKRNRFTIRKSVDIWTHYTLSAFLHSKGQKRSIILYDQLFGNWIPKLRLVSTELEIPWPKDEAYFKQEMDDFIEPDLQHSKSGLKELRNHKQIPDYVSSTYSLILQAERSKTFFESEDFMNQVEKLYQQFISRK